MDFFRGYNIIVDGCDNFPTRYLVNDAAVLSGKPVVHGSIFQFEGQASVFHPPSGPCYRCLFPHHPRQEWCRREARLASWEFYPGSLVWCKRRKRLN